VPNLPRLSAAVVAKDNGLGVASLLDLAGTKASVVQIRAEAKDYIDIDALITVGKVDLPLALSAAQRLYGSTFNPQITSRLYPFRRRGSDTTSPGHLSYVSPRQLAKSIWTICPVSTSSAVKSIRTAATSYETYSSHHAKCWVSAKNHLVRAARAGAREPSPISWRMP